jgi:hypothetical protein
MSQNQPTNERSKKFATEPWKMVIGPKLKARNFPNQKTEVRIGTNILNKMNGLGRANYEAVA